LKRNDTLALTDADLGLSATYYRAGCVAGALLFGYLTDRWGRKKLFSITILLYLCATGATAFSWNFASFTFFRALNGADTRPAARVLASLTQAIRWSVTFFVASSTEGKSLENIARPMVCIDESLS